MSFKIASNRDMDYRSRRLIYSKLEEGYVFQEEGLMMYSKKALTYLVRLLVFPYGLFRLKMSNRVRDVHRFVEVAFGLWGIISPAQIKEEIFALMKILSRVKPRVVLEIGTGRGGTLFLLTKVSDPEAMIISIDLPGGPFGGGYPKWRIPIFKSFVSNGQRMYLLRRDSHDPATLDQVKGVLKGGKVDFLFIDGDHTYEGVKKDFEMYSPMVKRRGLIAFHDICAKLPGTGCEVDKFWGKIKHAYQCTEIVKDWKQGWAGIGVLYV